MLPPHAQAQRGQKKSFYKIHVFKEQDACLYEIEDYADQDQFLIEPYGIVDFHATGTNARVEVQSSRDGVPGTERERKLKLRDGKAPKSLRARGPRQKSSDHKIAIRCCGGTSLGRCEDEQEAQPGTVSTGQAPRIWGPSDLFFGKMAARGPNVGMKGQDAPPLPAGGPIMKVVED